VTEVVELWCSDHRTKAMEGSFVMRYKIKVLSGEEAGYRLLV